MATTRSRSRSQDPEYTAAESAAATTAAAAAREVSSLKRVREGSVEPTHVEPSSLGTKKNRVVSSTPVKDASVAEDENENGNQDAELALEGEGAKEGESKVGEVREKVEKMSYDEPLHPGSQSASRSDLAVATLSSEDNTIATDHTNEADVSEPNAERVDTGNHSPKSEGLKRKALDERSTSLATERQDAVAKKAKEVPKTDILHAPSAPAPKKPQATFSSFASSASPYASIKTSSPLPELQGASPVPVSAETDPEIKPVPKTAAVEKKKPASFGDFSSGPGFASAKTTTSSKPSDTPPLDPSADPAPARPKQPTFSSFSSVSPFTSKSSTPKPSPFGSAMPATGSAFGTYSGTGSAFGGKMNEASSVKNGEAGQAEGKTQGFGDILKEVKDDMGLEEKKVEMQEQNVTTGEEDEQTVFQARSKLFVNEKGWKERGVGLLKLNVRRSDSSNPRLVMRADGVLRLLMNSKLYKGLNPTVEGKTVLMTLPGVGEKELSVVCLRLANTKTAEELAELIHQHIPLDSTETGWDV